MKTLRNVLYGVVLLLALGSLGSAQTAVTSTTLSSAISDSSGRSIVVASATGINAPSSSDSSKATLLLVDRELMFVTAVNGTNVTVIRGYNSTRGGTHSSGATVYIGPYAGVGSMVHFGRLGSCTSTNEQYLPQIAVDPLGPYFGYIFDCYNSQFQVDDNLPRYKFTVSPNAQRSATSPSAGNANSITSQAGGAQSATTGNGAAGGAFSAAGGVGGIGGSSSGTAGAGGAYSAIGGAGGAGPITGGAGGAASLGAGVGGAGSSAGGSGGLLNLFSGAAGSGGTGTAGSISLRQGGAAGVAALSVSAAGATTLASTVTGQAINITPFGSASTVFAGVSPQLDLGVAGSVAGGAKFENATSGSITVAPPTGALGTVTNTLPAITGGMGAGFSCGSTGSGSQTCAPASVNGQLHWYVGSSALSSNAATITFPVAFASTTSYFCVANDVTTRANPVQMIPASGTTATITDTTGASDTIQWFCAGQ